MLSAKSALVVSACSVGIGVFMGRRSCNADLKENGYFHFQSENAYVFPTAFAKSVSLTVPTDMPVKSQSNKKQSNSVHETLKYGFPSFENMRTYEDFILSYDKRNRIANWVLEHLTPDKVNVKNADRSKVKFAEDESFHAFHRATNKDFQGSGYDRGHLAAAANHRHSQSAMSQTFLLSNVSPQVGEGFNRDAWNNLEKYTRALARKNKNVYVCTGPLYLPRAEANGKMYVKYEVIGESHVAVPTHFFKVLLIENEKGEKDLQSFVLPNQSLRDIKLKQYLVPLESIERAAGLHFFDKLPKETFKRINAVPNL